MLLLTKAVFAIMIGFLGALVLGVILIPKISDMFQKLIKESKISPNNMETICI